MGVGETGGCGLRRPYILKIVLFSITNYRVLCYPVPHFCCVCSVAYGRKDTHESHFSISLSHNFHRLTVQGVPYVAECVTCGPGVAKEDDKAISMAVAKIEDEPGSTAMV